MATFTSVQTGNWNDGATWGNTSPGSKGTDWPGNAGDVVNIGTTANQSHVVTYNVSEANELGAITIGATSGTGTPKLTFLNSMTTLLSLGHVDITVNIGTLEVDLSGTTSYTATIAWNTTSDAAKGISLTNAASVLILKGNVNYYGDDYQTYLTSDWNGSATTIYVAGDFSSKWVTGQKLVLHKGRTYGTTGTTNDFALVTINGAITYGAGVSTIPITVTHAPSTATSWLTNGDVFNVSRNVILKKVGASEDCGNCNTNRPQIKAAYQGMTTAIELQATEFLGMTWIGTSSYQTNFNDCSYRNGGNLFAGPLLYVNNFLGTFADGLFVYGSANAGGVVTGENLIFAGFKGGYIMNGANYINIDTLVAVGCNFTTAGVMAVGKIHNLYYYSNGIGFNGVSDIGFKIYGGAIGADDRGNVKANTYDLRFEKGSQSLIGVDLPASPTFQYRTGLYGESYFYCEAYDQASDDHSNRVYSNHADAITGTQNTDTYPAKRTGGNDTLIEVVAQSTMSPFRLFRYHLGRRWLTSGAKTLKVYVYTDYTGGLTAADVYIEGAYISSDSPRQYAKVGPSTTTVSASTWTGLTLTFTQAAAGWVEVLLFFTKYESAKKLWIDPLIEIT